MKRLLLIALLASCQPSYATQTEALVFTDADVLQPSGGVPACVVEVPTATFILVDECRNIIPGIKAEFTKRHPGVPFTIELNGESLSSV
jgi:hypothetical protein